VVLCNLRSGRVHAFGKVEPNVLLRSFYSDEQ
jgi:hypothetical protein